MGLSIEKPSRLRKVLRLLKGGVSGGTKSPAKTTRVNFDLENIQICSYPAPEGPELALIYPSMTEKDTKHLLRKDIMCGYVKGSAAFKDLVEKVYSGAHKNYDEEELSSSDFSLAPATDDKLVIAMAASEIRGLEEIYCGAISDHRQWAVRRVVRSQRDKNLRKRLPDIAAGVSIRSKNFARLIALGDAEEAAKAANSVA